jgi:hypothetical protein
MYTSIPIEDIQKLLTKARKVHVKHCSSWTNDINLHQALFSKYFKI